MGIIMRALFSICLWILLFPQISNAVTPSVWTNKFTIYVDPNGNDSTAIPGRPDKPYAQPDVASSHAPIGSCLYINPGTYNITNSTVVPTNGSCYFAGAVITNWNTGLLNPGFRMTDNSILDGGTIVSGNSAATFFQSHFGNGSSATFQPTNFVIRHVAGLNGGSDVFYFSGSTVSGDVYDSYGSGRWDIFTYQNGGLMRCYNCTFISTGPNFLPGDENLSHAIAVGNSVQNTHGEFYNCKLSSANTNSVTVFSSSGAGIGPFTNFFLFSGCTFTNTSTAYGTTNFASDAFASNYVALVSCVIDNSNLWPGMVYDFYPRQQDFTNGAIGSVASRIVITGQGTNAITTTTNFTSAVTAVYDVVAFYECTSGGAAGTMTMLLGHTDDIGTENITLFGSVSTQAGTRSGTTTAGNPHRSIRCVAGSPITYSATVTSSLATSWNVYVSFIRVQ